MENLILKRYDEFLKKTNKHFKENTLQETIQNKKLILRDTELGFEKIIKYSYANEFKEYKMFVGKCFRKTFFEWNNDFEYDTEFTKITKITKSMKDEFLSFIAHENGIKERDASYELITDNFIIKGKIDAIYLRNGKECMLHFESIKNNYFVKDNEDVKGNPLARHILKLIPAMIYTSLPVTLVYQDRGTLELNKYEIHLDNYNIYINGVIYEEFTLGDVINNINRIHEEIKENLFPSRNYFQYKKEDLFILSNKKLISKKESDEIFAGLKVQPFDCNKCAFKLICNSLPETAFKTK